MLENVIKKLFPIRDEQGRPCTFPTFASQVFFNDGSVLEGKGFGGENAAVDPLTIYPVGSIYISANSTSPASLFGGTWEQIKGRFLLGAGGSYTLGNTGGAEKVTLTVGEMPRHSHVLDITPTDSPTGAPNLALHYQYTTNEPYSGPDYMNYTGENQAHNNMPPWEAVNIWKRVA